MKKKKPFVYSQKYDPAFLKGGEIHKGARKNGWLKNWKEKKIFQFTWDYCEHCQVMFVRCPACGNNCCNAGFGKVKSLFEAASFGDETAVTCPTCNLAYAYQELAWKTKTAPKPTAKQVKDGKKRMKQFMSDLNLS